MTAPDRLAPCVFCEIAEGTAPATIVAEWPEAIAIVPLGPVTEGHTLIIPRRHVTDYAEHPYITAATMRRAAEYTAARHPSANIITSRGRAATQSVFHLHVHVVPRAEDDGLMVPWGTVYGDDPQAPHWCRVAQRLQDQLDAPSADSREVFEAGYLAADKRWSEQNGCCPPSDQEERDDAYRQWHTGQSSARWWRTTSPMRGQIRVDRTRRELFIAEERVDFAPDHNGGYFIQGRYPEWTAVRAVNPPAYGDWEPMPHPRTNSPSYDWPTPGDRSTP